MVGRKNTRSKNAVKPAAKPATSDPVAGLYYAEVGRYALPTKAQERELFRQYAEARDAAEFGRSARQRAEGKRALKRIGQEIACGYLRFVIQQAGRKTTDPTLLKDLIGQGNIGLMIGVSRFDLKYKTRFLTYAASWIRVCMQDYLHKRGVVHVPSHTRKEVKKRKTRDDGSTPAHQEDVTLVDFDDVTATAPDDTYEEVSRREHGSLAALQLANLTRVERMTLLYTFGLRGVEMQPPQLAQMLYELGLGVFTAKSVNATKTTALRKLRAAYAAKGLTSLTDVL